MKREVSTEPEKTSPEKKEPRPLMRSGLNAG
jgi:hypothetical protein